MTSLDLREQFERCISGGGVALFPSDTVYGLACDPTDADVIRRLYSLKDRPPAKSAAIMFFDLETALTALPELGERTRDAMNHLMPGGVTVLLPNPAGRFPLACAADPTTLGVRVVSVPVLAGATVAVLQSSANLAGGVDARRLSDVTGLLRSVVDLEIDGGDLPGTSSTVLDLRGYEAAGDWTVVREGAVPEATLFAALGGQFHFNPETYPKLIREDISDYDAFQDAVVQAGRGRGVGRILELGTGTGETARRLLEAFPAARLVGIDESAPMLEVAAGSLPAERVVLQEARLQDTLPAGPFDLVATALCVHHLDAEEKADLFRRVRSVLAPRGRFVLGDVVVPDDPARARISLTSGYDKPSSLAAQLQWLEASGFDAAVVWNHGDLVVITAAAPG